MNRDIREIALKLLKSFKRFLALGKGTTLIHREFKGKQLMDQQLLIPYKRIVLNSLIICSTRPLSGM